MLDSLGDIGDFVGGIGVVITLAYLAVQIRHSSKVAALSAGHSISIGITEFFERIALDPQLQSLWMRALDSPDTLDEAERARFGLLILGLFGRFLNAHRHGELDPQIAVQYDAMARHYLGLTAVASWWASSAQAMHQITPDLARYIDGLRRPTPSQSSPAA
jgi:hypothetical protein